jgi:hypothetical protein
VSFVITQPEALKASAGKPLRAISHHPGPFITGLAFLVYLSTLSRNYYGDGIQFAMLAEDGDLRSLLQPNHMLYPLLGRWFYRAWQLFGWHGGALLPLQVLSAVGGALSVGLIYGIARKITNSTTIALLIAFGFGISAGMWLFSTDAKSVTMPLALSLLLLYALLSDSHSSPWGSPITLGLLCILSIATYETGVFLVGVVIVGYLLKVDLSWTGRCREALIFLLITGFATACLYVSVAFFVFGITNWRGLVDWQSHMASLDLWGKPSLRSVPEGGYAFVRDIAGYPGLNVRVPFESWFSSATHVQQAIYVIYGIIVALVAIAPLAIAFKQRQLIRDYRRVLAMIATWAVAYAAFAIYWVAGDYSFWVPVLVSWWLLIGILIAANTSVGGERNVTVTSRWTFFRIAKIVVIVIFVINLTITIVPNLTPNRSYRIAMSVKEHTTPDDLIVTPGGGDLFLTIPYFAERRTVSIYHSILGLCDSSKFNLCPILTYSGPEGHRNNKRDVFNDVDRMIRDVQLRGGQVFLIGLQPGRDARWSSLSQETGLTKEDFNHFKTRYAWQVCGEDVREIIP